MKTEVNIILFSLLLGLLAWTGDGLTDFYVLKADQRDIWDSLIFAGADELASRVGVLVAFLIFGIAIAVNSARRKGAEISLRAGEEKYRDLVERTSDWAWEVDPVGIYTYASPRVTDMLDYDPEEVVGKTPFDFMHEDEAARVRKIFGRIASEKAPIKLLENTLVRKDGTTMVVETSGVPILDEFGNLKGYRGIDRDITDRKRMEEALQISNQMLRLVLDSIPAFVFWKDRNSVYLGCNIRFAANAGFDSPDDVIGKTDFDFPWKNTEAEGYRRDDQIVMSTGVPKINYEETQLTADGRLTWVRTSKIPLRDINGRIVGVLGTFEDITERKRAQKALEHSESKYKNLIETTETGYLIVDDIGRVIDANDEYVRLTGRNNLAEILGRTVLDWTAPYDLERNTEEIRKCMETGLVRNLEIDYIAPDGRITPIEINATVIDTPEGRNILTLCRDITERRVAEEERTAYEKQSEEQKRQFYRETILNVTGGKLDICDAADVDPYIQAARLEMEVPDKSAISKVRHAVDRFCRKMGLSEERTSTLVLGVGEAATNAVKHAKDARVFVGADTLLVWVVVLDKGTGIDSLILPKAVLLRGYSTKPSLGLGYSIMLEVADRVLVNTEPTGTKVVLVKNLQAPDTRISLSQIPDTWEAVV